MTRWLLPIVAVFGIGGDGCGAEDLARPTCGGEAVECAGRIRIECPEGFVPWFDGHGYAICAGNPCAAPLVPIYLDHVTGHLPGEKPVEIPSLHVECVDAETAGQIDLYR